MTSERRGLPRGVEAVALVGLTLVFLVAARRIGPPPDAVTMATPEYGLEVKSSHPSGAADSLEAARRGGPVVATEGGATRDAPAPLLRVTRLAPPRRGPVAPAARVTGRVVPSRWLAWLPEERADVGLFHFDGASWTRLGKGGRGLARVLEPGEATDLARSLVGPEGLAWGEDLVVVVGNRDEKGAEAVASALVARSHGMLRRERPWDPEGVASWLGLGASRAVHALCR